MTLITPLAVPPPPRAGLLADAKPIPMTSFADLLQMGPTISQGPDAAGPAIAATGGSIALQEQGLQAGPSLSPEAAALVRFSATEPAHLALRATDPGRGMAKTGPITSLTPATKPAKKAAATNPVEGLLAPILAPTAPRVMVPTPAPVARGAGPLEAAMAEPAAAGTPPTHLIEPFDTVRPPVSQRTRVFAFNELGMFGQYAAQSLVAEATNNRSLPALPKQNDVVQRLTEDVAAPVTREPMRQLEQPLQQDVAPERRPDMSLVSPSAVPAEAGLSSETLIVGRIVPRATEAASPVGDAAANAMPEVEDGEAENVPLEGSAGMAGRSPPRAAPASNETAPVSVLVAGQSAALSIAVRYAADNADDYARLRRLVEDTAAEFGMNVGELQINGSATEPSFQTMLGGNRGNRAN
jgi:hypothetical protein